MPLYSGGPCGGGKGISMNFDFSEEERKYHLELESTLAGFIAEENLGEGDSGITGEIAEKCLHVLAGNRYLNLGLEKSDIALGGSSISWPVWRFWLLRPRPCIWR